VKKTILILSVLLLVSLFVIGCSNNVSGNAFAYNLPRSCTDSDGGNNPGKQGTADVKDLSSAKMKTFTDSCENPGNLLEHYCAGDVHLTETIPCVCDHGACKFK
jgi:hypothetical protein